MNIFSRKAFWWAIFNVSAQTWLGLLLAFALDLNNARTALRFTAASVHIFIFSFVLSAVAIPRLLELYQLEPPNWKGRWQYSITDLLAITLFGAVSMAVAKSLDPGSFVNKGLFLALFVTCEFAATLLFAARAGCSTVAWRVLYAHGLLLCSLLGTVGFWLCGAVVYAYFFYRLM